MPGSDQPPGQSIAAHSRGGPSGTVSSGTHGAATRAASTRPGSMRSPSARPLPQTKQDANISMLV